MQKFFTRRVVINVIGFEDLDSCKLPFLNGSKVGVQLHLLD